MTEDSDLAVKENTTIMEEVEALVTMVAEVEALANMFRQAQVVPPLSLGILGVRPLPAILLRPPK